MLDLMETSVLFEALSRRFKFVVLLAEKEYGQQSEMEGYYSGGFTPAIGLLARGPRFFHAKRPNKGSHPE